jgi:hypothetical protein
MIRIEGIPIVTARLMANARKAKPVKVRRTTHARPQIASRMPAKRKVA